MNAPDMFAMGGRQDDDTEILVLFREWCAAWRASNHRGLTDDECDAAVDVADEIAERIYNAPVQGVVGLAIKTYMVAEGRDGLNPRRSDDPCTLSAFAESCYSVRRANRGGDVWIGTDVAHLYMPSHALRGLLASAAAFVPELRPLVQRAVKSPPTLPIDDDDAEGAVA